MFLFLQVQVLPNLLSLELEIFLLWLIFIVFILSMKVQLILTLLQLKILLYFYDIFQQTSKMFGNIKCFDIFATWSVVLDKISPYIFSFCCPFCILKYDLFSESIYNENIIKPCCNFKNLFITRT